MSLLRKTNEGNGADTFMRALSDPEMQSVSGGHPDPFERPVEPAPGKVCCVTINGKTFCSNKDTEA